MANRPASLDQNVYCIADLVEFCNKRVTKTTSEYIAGGAMDMIT